MKRMWIGVALLALVLAAGILGAEWMEKTHEDMKEDVRQAAFLAMMEQWDEADALVNGTRWSWQKKRPAIAMLADHEPLEHIDSLFSQLEVYAAARETTAFGAVCADLCQQLEALGDYHKCTFSNLL